MSTTRQLSHIHRFVPGHDPSRPPLLLLHGTGGDENDLLGLGEMVAPGSALLSVRGKVLENGMPRFFRRLREGVFDEEDLRHRAAELAAFIGEAREAYRLGAPVALGFSNGANIAAALLLLHPQVLAGATLLRPMMPLQSPPSAVLDGKPVLMLSGAADPMVTPANVGRLADALRERGAIVRHETLPAGHGLTQADVGQTKTWLEAL